MTKISATVMGAVLSVLAGGTRGDAGAWGLSQDAANKGMATRQKHRTTPTFQTLTRIGKPLHALYAVNVARGMVFPPVGIEDAAEYGSTVGFQLTKTGRRS